MSHFSKVQEMTLSELQVRLSQRNSESRISGSRFVSMPAHSPFSRIQGLLQDWIILSPSRVGKWKRVLIFVAPRRQLAPTFIMAGHLSQQRCNQTLTSAERCLIMDRDLENYFAEVIGVCVSYTQVGNFNAKSFSACRNDDLFGPAAVEPGSRESAQIT